MSDQVYDYIIYTDGSANSGPTGGSACIVENSNTLERYHLTASYLEATNNQAEIFATLMAYAFITSLHEEVPWKLRVKVVSDSEHVLDCSVHHIFNWLRSGKLYNDNLPLKNRGFWQLFVKLSEKLDLTGEHVKGHSGHFDNERCDNAASWSRKKRHEDPDFTNPCMVELIKKKRKSTTFSDNWFHFDAEPTVKLIRDEKNIQLDQARVQLQLAVKGYFENELPLITTQDRVLKAIIDRIKEGITMANKYKSQDPRITDLEKKLIDLVGEYKDEHY